MKQKVVAVFGYNNTRLYDVLKIRDRVESRADARLLLVKEGIGREDEAVTPYCLDFGPESPSVADVLERYLLDHDLELLGVLPFSDKGVIGAAETARRFGLCGDDCETASAMLDKSEFRERERSIPLDCRLYKKPFFKKAHSEEELRLFLSSAGSFFLKPTSEGNSRGCMKIESVEDLDRWLKENPKALAGGVICEEILGLAEEYSFDGVAGAYWITKKFTTSGAYRAEYQHVVPAPLEPETQRSIHRVLEPLLWSLGSRGGAFHHEFFLGEDRRVASVEPNRRPAGMWIWDLAAWSFEEFDPWDRWIDRCVGTSPGPVELKPSFYSGVRGVISEKTGTLTAIQKQEIEGALQRRFGESRFRVSFLKEAGSSVRSEPRDNSDFLAFIALKDPGYDSLLEGLDEAHRIFLDHSEVVS